MTKVTLLRIRTVHTDMVTIVGETAGLAVILPPCRILSRTVAVVSGVIAIVVAIVIAIAVVPIIPIIFWFNF